MRSPPRAVLPVLALTWALAAEGQQYRFREYRQENGLGNLAVTALLQDRDRYLWVGTQNGLFRYDGARFRHFGRAEGLPGAYILALVEAPDGTIWVSTHMGIARLVGGKIIAEHMHQFVADGTGMAVAPDGTLYAAAPGGILVARRSGKAFTYAFELAYIPTVYKSKTIVQIVTDDKSRAWFGCGTGLCVLAPGGSLAFHQTDLGIPADRWDGIAIDPAGTTWLRSNSRLLQRHPGQSQFTDVQNPAKSANFALLMNDRNGHLFLPSIDGLWMRLPKTGAWRKIGRENGLNGEVITALLRDHEEGVWIGFLGDGLTRWIVGTDWEGWTKADGLNGSSVWAITRDKQRTLWAATDNGINFLEEKGGRWQSLGGAAGKKLGRVIGLSEGANGTLWGASQLKGLVRIDTRLKSYVVLGFPLDRPYLQLQHVYLDQRKRLWLATTAGLCWATEEKPLHWTLISDNLKTPSETIYTVTEDGNGRIWAAGNLGVLQVGESGVQRYDASNGLLSNAIWYARETERDQIWIGYLDNVGKTRIDLRSKKPQFTHSKQSGGEVENVNYFVGKDRANMEWLGTDHGVYVGDGQQSFHLTDQDGLIWNDCNSNAFFADDDGSVWIGTARGLSHGRFRMPSQPPLADLRVNTLLVNGKEVDATQPIKIPAGGNSVELTVSPLTFRYDNRLTYRYRLGPDGRGWATRPTPVITFNGVRGGKARLQARVRIDQYPWSETLVDVPVEVAVPFWQSGEGRLVMGLIAVAIVLLIWRSRNRTLIAEKSQLARAVAARTREIERLLEQSHEANRLKSEFLANMSHEIRTPMNGVLGMLQLIEGTELKAEQRSYVELAKDSADSLLALLNEILDLSKVESGHLELELQIFNLHHCIYKAVGLLEGNADKKRLSLKAEVGGATPTFVVGDPMRLQQVLLNLLGNAIKFTEAGSVELLVGPGETGEGKILFEVRDTGIGIAADKLGLIFEAFRQADGSTTRRFGGTGLGLAISRKLVELMGGKIAVESVAGRGSRFFFTIALPEAGTVPGRPETNSHDAQVTTRRLKILLAEDNRVNQIVVTKLLEREGHEVRVAEDGISAVDIALRESFDLILMDVHMPALDGISATKRIREAQSKASRYTPIFALTAGVLAEERDRCLKAGMDEFLAKPVREEDLRAAIRLIVR